MSSSIRSSRQSCARRSAHEVDVRETSARETDTYGNGAVVTFPAVRLLWPVRCCSRRCAGQSRHRERKSARDRGGARGPACRRQCVRCRSGSQRGQPGVKARLDQPEDGRRQQDEQPGVQDGTARAGHGRTATHASDAGCHLDAGEIDLLAHERADLPAKIAEEIADPAALLTRLHFRIPRCRCSCRGRWPRSCPSCGSRWQHLIGRRCCSPTAGWTAGRDRHPRP